MKPQHVIAWAIWYIQSIQEDLDRLEIRYKAAKYSYECDYLAKLFGWQYEDSYAGNRGWMGWDFWSLEGLKNRAGDVLLEARYKAKCSYATMNLEKQVYSNSFYAFCEANNIPF